MKLFLSIFLVTLIGCHGGWKKDPLEDKSSNIKNAQPGGPEKPIPPLKDVVFIDADEFYDFKAGQEKTINFNYRITHPDLSVIEFAIPGLEDTLPGAVFDSTGKTLVWQPGENFVAGAQFLRRVPIFLVLYVDNNGVIEEHRKKVAINVLRSSLEAPTITQVTSLTNRIREGRSDSFRVSVKDVHSNSQDRPMLSVVSTATGSKDGTGLVLNLDTQPSQDFLDPTIWHFDMRVDVAGKEITATSQLKEFGLRAVSAFGVPSLAWKGDFRVLTQIEAPSFFVQDRVFYKDEENSYSFSIVDPKKEGVIVVDSSWEQTCADLTPQAKCSCQSSGPQALCTIQWKPGSLNGQRFTVRATNTINDAFIQDRVRGRFSFKIDVEESGN